MDSSSSSLGRDSAPQVRVSLHNIWKEIETVRTEIRVVVGDIEKAYASLTRLKTAEQNLLDAAAATASLLPGPFQDFPPEIVGEVAAYLLLHLDERPCISKTNKGIWPLTYVCQSWRNAIISFPELWSSFSVASARNTALRLLPTVLERSRQHPLSLHLSLFPSRGTTASSIVALLVQHSRRWKQITLNAAVGPTPLLPLRGHLPQLEKLELRLSESVRSRAASRDIDPWFDSVEERGIFEDAPKLAELKIEAIPNSSRGTFVKLKFPFHQIKTIHHVDFYPVVPDVPVILLNDLATFSNVSDLYLGGNARLPITGPITLHSLMRLGLRKDVSALVSLRLPSLTALELSNVTFEDSENELVKTFLTIHSESFADWALGTLVVKDEYPVSQYIDILSHDALNELHTLTCIFGSFLAEEDLGRITDILSILVWAEPARMYPGISRWGSVNVLPRLRTLALEFSASFDGDVFPLIRAIVISRTTSLGTLEVTHENGHTTDSRAGPQDEVDNPSSESTNTPSRLQDFYIKYDHDLPAVTMKDLNDMTKGKFIVMG